MAFQNTAGTIIIDAVLTDLGRRRMAQGNFKIEKFGYICFLTGIFFLASAVGISILLLLISVIISFKKPYSLNKYFFDQSHFKNETIKIMEIRNQYQSFRLDQWEEILNIDILEFTGIDKIYYEIFLS